MWLRYIIQVLLHRVGGFVCEHMRSTSTYHSGVHHSHRKGAGAANVGIAIPRVHFDVRSYGSDSVSRLSRSLSNVLSQTVETVPAGVSLPPHPRAVSCMPEKSTWNSRVLLTLIVRMM